MKNKISKLTLYVLIISFFTIPGYSQVDDTQIYKLTQVINNISNYYTDSINGSKLIEQTIVSALKKLDPHSTYFTKDELEEVKRGLEGSFDGIGITYNILKDTILVLSTVPDGPSDKAGIVPGDRILKVENELVAGIGITTKKVREKFLGKKGTELRVVVLRYRNSKPIDVTITRDKIAVNSIEASYMAAQGIGYIRLNRFSATSTKEFIASAKKLKRKGAKHLIFDLRNNSGGYLHIAVQLVDIFLKDEKLIVYTKGLKSPKKYYRTKNEGMFEEGKLVLLINEGSASASEIVCGAIQDWDRGVIVGRRSYGKGLVQRPFHLIDGSMMRLTIARYFTPAGRCIQKPYSDDLSNYFKDISNRLKSGELMCKDSISFPDSLKYYTLNKNRIVYGGGGIMPDVFVSLDTSLIPEFYKNWISDGKINNFVHYYVDKNRSYLNTVFSNFETFKKNFKIDKTILEGLINFSDSETEEKQNAESINFLCELSNNYIVHNQIKALIANDLWDSNEYYQIYNSKSPSFLKALNIIKDNCKYKSIIE